LFLQDTLTTELLKFVAREGEYSNWIIKVTVPNFSPVCTGGYKAKTVIVFAG